jgi:anaerobic selenocysteine-containing dehydrogenase
MTRTVFHACSLCEAVCGLRFEVDGDRILSVRPDDADAFSAGFACPKGVSIADVHADPDRVRQPMWRTRGGAFEPISWDDAFDLTAARLSETRRCYGGDSVGLYWGNPIGHNHGAALLVPALTAALGTRNRYSAGSQDGNPRVAVSYHLYGSGFSLPVPDVDRTMFFLCIGANPLVSNGSVMTAPNMRARMRSIRDRGGKIVVIDPRRTETARTADEHIPIRPGTDAALLLALTHVIVADGSADCRFLESATSGWHQITARLDEFSPARVEAYTGIPAATITRLAREFAASPASVAYSRIGVCVGPFATLATWATDLLNVVAGRLGRRGGAMFPTPPIDLVEIGRRTGLEGLGRWYSRVRRLPETMGDLPSATLVDEIETPGDGQIRALITLAGNPVLSAPNGRRLSAALERLDFMVSIDIYVNETTRHADLILPPAWSLTDDHVDIVFAALAVRNFARWSPPVLARGADELHDWEILLELTERLGGGPTGSPAIDRILRVAGRLGYRWKPSQVVDLLLRTGPYGDRFLPWSDGLSLAKLRKAQHGIDLGPMKDGHERRVYHADKKIHLDAAPLVADLARLTAEISRPVDADQLLLIGRRELRSNNSWMHNVAGLVSGRERCVLYMHPTDAQRRGITDGSMVSLASRVHEGDVRVELTEDMMPGVVSLPHGWGHGSSAQWQRVAGARPGVSANDWTDDAAVEPVIGQSILNAVPVRVERVSDVQAVRGGAELAEAAP